MLVGYEENGSFSSDLTALKIIRILQQINFISYSGQRPKEYYAEKMPAYI